MSFFRYPKLPYPRIDLIDISCSFNIVYALCNPIVHGGSAVGLKHCEGEGGGRGGLKSKRQ